MDIKTKIKAFIEKEILNGEVNKLTDDTQLIDEGIVDSMGIMKLLAFLEEALSIKIGSQDLTPENFETINTIVNLVKKPVLVN